MKLYRTASEIFLETEEQFFSLGDLDWDELINSEDLQGEIEFARRPGAVSSFSANDRRILAPVESQDIWAAGVTYFRSRTARMEESDEAGGGDFYDRVYDADRPELFPKSSPHRVVGHGTNIRLRSDASWNVPEPELVALVNAAGKIIGYTVGNDVSSRDIEGENPLYLPQAKIWDGSCALGPCVLLSSDPLPKDSSVALEIVRGDETAFEGAATLEQMKRTVEDLVEYLYRECSFPTGCFLMTGTGTVPPNDFTLKSGDSVRVSIDGIGTLENTVE